MIPAYRFGEMFKRRKKLMDISLLFVGYRLTADRFEALVRSVARLLKVPEDPVRLSLLSLAGKRWTEEQLQVSLHRLAANWKTLFEGKPVYPWVQQTRLEWAAVQVLRVFPKLTSKGKPGAKIRLRFLTGTPAGKVINRWFSLKECRQIARRIGFSRPPSVFSREPVKYLYRMPDDLVTLRFFVQLEPALSSEIPGFRTTGTNASVKSWNSEQLRHRFRSSPRYPCPRELPRSFPCRNCSASLADCRASTHGEIWKVIDCSVCRKAQVLAYPEDTAICVRCRRLNDYKITGGL